MLPCSQNKRTKTESSYVIIYTFVSHIHTYTHSLSILRMLKHTHSQQSAHLLINPLFPTLPKVKC